MKDGYIVKDLKNNGILENDLKLINNYTRRELNSDEVYVFSLVLCDNDIDRDYEKFTKESLEKLAELFVGKTGILDHDTKSNNQKARIFSCAVEKVPNKFTKDNEPYYRLKAKAYMPKIESNNEFIMQIDSGIKKEVSVGCAVEKVTCSICNSNIKGSICNHTKGKVYNNKLCYAILKNPIDAYEWSFVAVPAQKEAGVTKMFNLNEKGGAINLDEIIKSLKSGQEISITKEESKKILQYINDLEDLAQVGKAYKEDLKKEVLKLCALAAPEIASGTMNSVAEKLSLEELKSFKTAFTSKINEVLPFKPQLATSKKPNNPQQNKEFKI